MAPRAKAASRPDVERPRARIAASSLPPEAEEPQEARENEPGAKEVPSLTELLEVPDAPSRLLPDFPRLRVDEARAAAAGIRKLSGRRLTLFTDLPPSNEVDVLPEVFDQAFPQWCEYFKIDPAGLSDWDMTGCLMNDKSAFVRAGLYRPGLPAFEHGFAWNYDLWLYEQPSDYYRRHLLLHEGTHGFMNTVLGGCGPPWYMEGIAEVLATHRWHEGRLTLDHMPANREEAPMWGRIKVIQDDFAAGKAIALGVVLEYRPPVDVNTEPYAWYWAAAALLDGHPDYRERFRQLPRLVLARDFNRRFYQLLGHDQEALAEQWQVFVGDLEYGYDVGKTAIDFTPGQPLPEAGASLRVAADRGWQNSGLRLEAGVPYRIRASGRYQVADQPQTWWCEPGGVSIRYYKGRPLGVLLAAVRPEPPRAQISALLQPVTVGLGAALTPEHSGTLFLRINDSAAELHDNAGSLVVHVMPARGG